MSFDDWLFYRELNRIYATCFKDGANSPYTMHAGIIVKYNKWRKRAWLRTKFIDADGNTS